MKQFFFIEYIYEIDTESDINQDSVSFVVHHYDEQRALESMSDLYYEEYVERIISSISEEEFDMFKDRRVAPNVYRVTRLGSKIIQYLNQKQNERIDDLWRTVQNGLKEVV